LKLKGKRALNVPLLRRRHRAVELPRLTVVIGEALRPHTQFLSCLASTLLLSKGAKSTLRVFVRPGWVQAIGLIGDSARIDVHPTHAIALQIPHRTARAVDRQLAKIGAAEPTDLGVGVGKQPSLQKGVVGEINSRNNVTRMERGLLRLGEEVHRVAIEHHPPDDFDGNNFLWNDFRRIKDVEVEAFRLLLVERLNAKFPFWKGALGDGLIEIAAMKVGVRSVDLYRFVPNDRGCADRRAPVEFDEGRFALGVDEPERMDPEPFHHPQGARDGPIGHDPQDHVHAFR
jgi:hypothetical protein